MHDRRLLGTADVTDRELARMVAHLWGCTAPVELLHSRAESVPYDLPALTTAGRYWVSGAARTPTGDARFRVFVKHVQSWSRSPLFDEVPVEHRDAAEASIPWRTEPLVYRSDLAARLPAGLSMPRPLGVHDLDELSMALWLEEVATEPVTWSPTRIAEAAHLLGRMAASPRVQELTDVAGHDWSVHDYVHGRLAMSVLPMLRSDTTWQHPLVTRAFDAPLRDRLLGAADRVAAYADELAAAPRLAAHGDACPNNLLRSPGRRGFVLIDFGFWGALPMGFDLGQLLVGDLQVGRGDPAELPSAEAAALPAYTAGIQAEGLAVDPETVRRAHALQLLIFTGLSSVPFEHLAAEPDEGLHAIASRRAAIARFCLDLLDATAG